jgi:hypothetical protein
MGGVCLLFLVVKMLSGEGSLLVWGGSVSCNILGPPVNLWSTGTIGRPDCMFSPWCEDGTSNVICVIVSVTVYTEHKCLSLLINVSESDSNISSVMSQSVTFSLYSHTAKCTSTKFSKQQTHHLLALLFKHQQCLACHMLLFRQGTDWSVQMKTEVVWIYSSKKGH